MRIYADTSALIAWFHPADEFAPAVTAWCRERAPEFCWNPLLRIELRHNLRRLSGQYAAVAWHACRASETSLRLRLGLPRLSDLLEWGDELSARHAQALPLALGILFTLPPPNTPAPRHSSLVMQRKRNGSRCRADAGPPLQISIRQSFPLPKSLSQLTSLANI